MRPHADPGPGIPLTLAEDRARRISDLRYDLRFSIPAERVGADHRTRHDHVHADGRVASAGARLRAPRACAASGRRQPIAPAIVTDHLVIVPAAHLRDGPQRDRHRVRRRRRGAQPQRRVPLHAVRAGAGAPDVPLLRSAGSEGAVDAGLDVPDGWQAVANGAETRAARGRRHGRADVCGDRSRCPTYLFAFAAGRFSVETAERDGRTFRMLHRETDAAKVARNRDAIFDLHAVGARLARALHRHSVSLGQVRLPARAVVPVRRHGACRRDLLQRVGPAARSVGDAEPEARPRQPHRPRNRAHVVRRSRDDALVQRRVDEGGLRELHGGEDRQSVVPGDQSRSAVPARALPVRVRDRSHAGNERDPPAARQPQRSRVALRRHHLSEGADRHAPARGASSARTPSETGCSEYLRAHRFAQRDVAGSDRAARRAHARGPRGVEPRLGRRSRAARSSHRSARSTTAASRACRSSSAIPSRGAGSIWNQRLQVALGLPDGAAHAARADRRATAPTFPTRAACRRRASCCRRAAASATPASSSTPPACDYLLTHLPDIDDPLTRGAAWITLWEQMLDRRTPASSIVDLALRALPRETDEQNVQRILGYARQAYWTFLPAAERDRDRAAARAGADGRPRRRRRRRA